MSMRQVNSMFGGAGRSTPVTLGLTVLVVLGAVLVLGEPNQASSLFGFSGSVFPKLWTLVTYPFVNFLGAFGLVFLPMWLFSIGGQVERDHGAQRFLILWLIITGLSVLPFVVLRKSLDGILIPDAALTVIWATRNPNACVRLFGLIPVKPLWLALLGVAAVLVTYGTGNLLLGGLALLSCGLAYLYASNRLPLRYGYSGLQGGRAKPTKAQRAKEDAYLSDVFVREQERADRERLRKLFEDSLEDDKK